jgi:hypothetical protein
MDKAVEAIEQPAPNPTATISSSQVIPFIIDMLDTNSISADIQDIFEDKIVNSRLLLINNAGVLDIWSFVPVLRFITTT